MNISEAKISNMKAAYKVLHDKAMEFVDEAQLAKMEGNASAANSFLEKAFQLEKEAALSAPDTEETAFVKSLYLRSAAYLADAIGSSFEALYLTQLGLAGNPPVFVAKQLEELQQKLEQQNASLEMTGLFAQADAKTNVIAVEEESSKRLYFIQVPTEQMLEIVQQYWAAKVAIVAKVQENGKVYLEKIGVAA